MRVVTDEVLYVIIEWMWDFVISTCIISISPKWEDIINVIDECRYRQCDYCIVSFRMKIFLMFFNKKLSIVNEVSIELTQILLFNHYIIFIVCYNF